MKNFSSLVSCIAASTILLLLVASVAHAQTLSCSDARSIEFGSQVGGDGGSSVFDICDLTPTDLIYNMGGGLAGICKGCIARTSNQTRGTQNERHHKINRGCELMAVCVGPQGIDILDEASG